MKQKIIIYLILFLFAFINTKAQWRGLTKNDSTIWYSDVQFLNKDTGYMTTPIGFINRTKSNLYITKDGGLNWAFVDSLVGEIYFHYFDYSHAIFQGSKERGGFYGLWKTQNGGKLLDSIPNTYQIGPPIFISKTTGFSTYSSGFFSLNGFGPLFKTKDMGIHWHKVLDGNVKCRKIWFPTDTLVGYTTHWNSTFDSSILYKTTDAGETWKTIYSKKLPSSPDYSEQWVFITKDMVLHSFDTAAYISRDGGKTWHDTYFYRDGFSRFVFTDTITTYGSKLGYIGKTTSKGFPWYQSQYSDSIYSSDIQFLNKDFAWAYAPVKSASQIYTINNASTWTGTITSIKEPFFHDEAIEIFPNPARNSVTVKAFGFKPGPIQLYCYDMNGKMVMSLALKQDGRGDLQQQLDVSTFSQGIYEVILLQGNRRQEKKVIIMGNE